MTPALVALIVLMLWPVPAVEAEPFVYVVGGPLGSRGIQVLTIIDAATNGKVASIPLGESCLCVNRTVSPSLVMALGCSSQLLEQQRFCRRYRVTIGHCDHPDGEQSHESGCQS
jgi:hypothetical protein